MSRFPPTLKMSLVACSLPGSIIALAATASAWQQWGGLSFSNPVFYATLAVAVWCPLSKLVLWRFWRRKAETCVTCFPARAISRKFS